MELTDGEYELVTLLGNHIKFDAEETKFDVKNQTALATGLENIDSSTDIGSLTVDDIVSDINKVNRHIEEVGNEPGSGVTSTCSTTLSILGLWHGASLSVAAEILGVAWFITAPIVTATGAIWVAGSIACP
ncbi:hypothetical protein [Alteribacter populi]|uniref:hypothetical protein n=1 Tax=Alteribacter populi TaxID=2011011 RepID=UPI000BBB4079|nr:hypothetical protein [Alteribacter populi]